LMARNIPPESPTYSTLVTSRAGVLKKGLPAVRCHWTVPEAESKAYRYPSLDATNTKFNVLHTTGLPSITLPEVNFHSSTPVVPFTA
jgi:hypothetical protein